MLKGFKDFVREQGVVGVAVGLAIGTQAGAAVTTLVEQFVNPLVGIVLQGTDLSSITTSVEVGDADPQVFGWGLIIQSVIVLLATAGIIYFVVKQSGLDKLDKETEE